MARSVLVIGAGPSGITAAKNLLDAGLEVTIVDRGREVGGNWVFDAESGHSSVFETTHIISSKRYSQYDDYPMPEGYPDYPSHKELCAYFQGYAAHFGVTERVRFETTVTRCEPAEGGGWWAETEHRGEAKRERYDVLVVANGHHWDPRWPSYPGHFDGELLHSHDFKRAEPFRGRRVLVIGGGNSACDVAVETARVSAQTAISWRRGYWIVPKFMFGVPTDHLHNAIAERLGFVPMKLRRKVLEKLLRFFNGPNASYGLPEPDHAFTETHPTLNSELLYFLRHGRIQPRPDIRRYDGHTVEFVDGRREDYDAIIACTGFRISHPFLAPSLVDFGEGKVPLYLRMIPAQPKDLYFIGLFQPLGCIWPLAELQSKILARLLSGRWSPPADLGAAIQRELEHPEVEQIDTPRHTITVDYPIFRRRLLAELGQGAG